MHSCIPLADSRKTNCVKGVEIFTGCYRLLTLKKYARKKVVDLEVLRVPART